MGKKSTPSAPQAPDPYATAAAQGQANRETAIANQELNMIDQYTPYGNLYYSEIGASGAGNPRYSVTQLLSPNQQRIKDLEEAAQIGYGQTANRQLGSVADLLARPVDFSSLGPAPQINEDTRQNVYKSIIDRNQPLFQQQYDQLQTRLANQGLSDPGSEAYKRAVDELYRGQNDFGLAAQNTALGQAATLYGLEQNQRNQALNELVQQRQIPLNELAALLTGTQVQQPNFVNTPQSAAAPAPIADSVYSSYQGDLNTYNAQLQAANAARQGLYGLIGTGLGAGAYAWGGR